MNYKHVSISRAFLAIMATSLPGALQAVAGPSTPATLIYEFPDSDLSFFGTEFVDTFPAPDVANITQSRLILTYSTGPNFSGEDLIIEIEAPNGDLWIRTGAQLGFFGMGTFINGVSSSELNGIYDVDSGDAFFTVRVRAADGQQLGGQFEDSQVEIDLQPAQAADLNRDGVVNGKDLANMLANWGPCVGSCPADLNLDEVVNGADLAQLLSAWG